MDKVAKIWDAKTGALIGKLEGHSEEITTVCISPDGTRIATKSKELAIIWNSKGAKIKEF